MSNQVFEFIKKHGFVEAKQLMENPVVPGADGFDSFWWREKDKALLQVSFCTGEAGNGGGWTIRFKKGYKKGDKPDFENEAKFEKANRRFIEDAVIRVLKALFYFYEV
ncbi:hypothetical protein J7J18_03590 [bacterium]|nr:hypothetical protein [bacterium]